MPIGRTNKGNLGIKFQANSEDFEIYLDAVPLRTTNILEDENNIELKKILEKYLFEEPQLSEQPRTIHLPPDTGGPVNVPYQIPKRRGRPVGSKNRSKGYDATTEIQG